MNVLFVGPKILCDGFKISGIATQQIEKTEDYQILMEKINQEKPSLIIYDSSIYKKLDAKQKKMFDTSVSPVFIQLTTSNTNGNSLKELVKNAIGIEIK